MSRDLIERIEGGIATLTMNRPEVRNALSAEVLDEAATRSKPDPPFHDVMRMVMSSIPPA